MHATNTSLSKLKIVSRQISDRIWVAFSRDLCDCLCVQSTYLSNHTLQKLEIFEEGFDRDVAVVVDHPVVVPENLSVCCKWIRMTTSWPLHTRRSLHSIFRVPMWTFKHLLQLQGLYFLVQWIGLVFWSESHWCITLLGGSQLCLSEIRRQKIWGWKGRIYIRTHRSNHFLSCLCVHHVCILLHQGFVRTISCQLTYIWCLPTAKTCCLC